MTLSLPLLPGAAAPHPRSARFITMTSMAAALGRRARRALGIGPENGWTLWHQAGGGDPVAARELVAQLTPAALALARQMLGRPEDAEDVVQESFLRLWSAQPDDTRGAQLATYFHTIVLNRCRSHLVRRRELSLDPVELAELREHQQMASQEGLATPVDGAMVRAALHLLPARQRMALALWAYADAEAAEIGQALGIDANAAHQLLFRARRGLRAVLQAQADLPEGAHARSAPGAGDAHER
ncbi:sigma-70 family RNA polymerase sigma factor [Hydrogenophaga sp.]|uniref:sigma-70 family RNA polymerase sigma factor n=1 Tax=Hydrogenophaga sp. TaxID=1904254 RepID=UPI0026035503|nr:sigma-70 family RNA polymerase sigma factor [Hydrogenophaga sp.]MCW5655380.1 sigma-70 family RNA polymerase sigma factor [Hydrogenophaga sp.]